MVLVVTLRITPVLIARLFEIYVSYTLAGPSEIFVTLEPFLRKMGIEIYNFCKYHSGSSSRDLLWTHLGDL